MGLRIAVVGLGSFGTRHAKTIKRLGLGEITAVVSRHSAKRLIPEARAYKTTAELLENEKIDAMVIAIPPFAHGDTEMLAARHGVPFFVEKPVSNDIITAHDILDEVRASGIITSVGYHYRYSSAIEKARELLQNEEPLSIHGYWLDSLPDAAWWKKRAEGGGQPRISYHIVHSPEIDKAATLVRLLHDLGDKQSMVFLNYRDAVDRLGQILKDNGIHHVRYHGGMEQVDREKSLSRFRSKSAYTMVTTDLAARGLDIDGVDAIIHYHLPMTEEAFVHRNGRSARWQAEGQVFTIINERETLPEWMPGEADEYEIKEGDRPIPQPKFTTIYIGKGKLDRISKGDIMGFLCKQASLGREDVGTITVKEKFSFAAIRTSKVKQAVKNTANEKLKGKKVLIEIANS